MPHTHLVIDDDSHFSIDKDTRLISTVNEDLILVQYDHNSERFTFECPKIIEGHDMTVCDSARIQYINIDKKTKNDSRGVYGIDDVTVSKADSNMIEFSWLISRNATKYVGPLNFLVEFICLDADKNVTYAWHTEIFKGVNIYSGIDNGPVITEDYPDILEQWKKEILTQVHGETVSYASVQNLTAEQQKTARANIGAFDANNGLKKKTVISPNIMDTGTVTFDIWIEQGDINQYPEDASQNLKWAYKNLWLAMTTGSGYDNYSDTTDWVKKIYPIAQAGLLTTPFKCYGISPITKDISLYIVYSTNSKTFYVRYADIRGLSFAITYNYDTDSFDNKYDTFVLNVSTSLSKDKATNSIENYDLASNPIRPMQSASKQYADTVSQKDWTQNDKNSSEYIKNRPGGYEETVPERTLVKYDLYGQISITLPEPLVIGQAYTVNGHAAIAQADSQHNNMPYIIIYEKEYAYHIGQLTMTSIDPPIAQISLGQSGASFDVIRSAYTRTVYLPSKYIEDMYYQETTESRVLYDLSTDTSQGGSLLNHSVIYVSEPITLGKTYVINNKTMEAYGSDDAPALGIYEGDASIGGITFSNEKTDQGYKGVIGCSTNTVIYSLKISTASSAIIHKIPEKYIPSQQFIITLTQTTSDNDDISFSVDKTYDEMIAAYNAGMNLRLTDPDGIIYTLAVVVQDMGISFISSNPKGFDLVMISKQNDVQLVNNNFATWEYVDVGIDIMRENLQNAINKKVDKANGKGLSTNDYTNDEKTKLEGVAAGAQVNVIETVKVNGVALTPSGKAVDVTVPSSLKNPNALTLKIGSTTVTYDGSAAQTAEIKNDMGITGAKVGQVIKIASVDDAGHPVKWEPVDMSSSIPVDGTTIKFNDQGKLTLALSNASGVGF